MERRNPNHCQAACLRCLMVLFVAIALSLGSMTRADDTIAGELIPSPAVANELFGEPDFVAFTDVAADYVAPDDVEPDGAEPALSEPVAIEPAQPTPVEAPAPVVEPAALPEASVPTPQALWQDRPIASLKATLHYTKGDLPPNKAAPRIAEAALIGETFGDIRPWVLSNYEWEAPATRHLPLLFEEPNLERMGYTPLHRPNRPEDRPRPRIAECMQPLISGAHFAGNLVMIPYRAGYQPLCQPVYTLGVDRPGSPAYYRKHETPLSLRGALYQAGFMTGLVFIIP